MGVDAIAAVSVARPLRADIHGTVRDRTEAMGDVHHFAGTSLGYPPVVHSPAAGWAAGQVGLAGASSTRAPAWARLAMSAPSKPTRPPGRSLSRESGGASRGGVQGVELAVIAGEDEAATDQLGGGDDVRVGETPRDGAVGLDRERLELGLHDHVGQSG